MKSLAPQIARIHLRRRQRFNVRGIQRKGMKEGEKTDYGQITPQQNSTTSSRRQLHSFPSSNTCWEGLFQCLQDQLKPVLPSSHSSACWALLWAISLFPMFLRRRGIPSARSSPWGRGLAPAAAAATFCWCSSSAARRKQNIPVKADFSLLPFWVTKDPKVCFSFWSVLIFF